MLNRRRSQRRKDTRAEVTWPATVITKHDAVRGRVANISRGGVLLYLQEQIELHVIIRIAIEIPECNDAMSMIGEVVRTFSIEKDIEDFSYAIGVKFTEISSQDLRFFTGNIAPEWQEDYKEPGLLSQSKQFLTKNIHYAILGILIFLLVYFAIPNDDSDKIEHAQIAAVESRLEKIGLQLENLQKLSTSSTKVNEQLNDIQNKLSQLLINVAPVAMVERLQAQVNINQQKIAQATPVIIKKSPEPAQPDFEKKKTTPPHAIYHVVKKGETLYRIARRYGVDVTGIRKLNNLLPDASIQPQQKLLIR